MADYQDSGKMKLKTIWLPENFKRETGKTAKYASCEATFFLPAVEKLLAYTDRLCGNKCDKK